MSNFFSTLDDSSDDETPKVSAPKTTQKKASKPKSEKPKQPTVMEPSKKAPAPDKKDNRNAKPNGSNTKGKGGRDFDRKSGTGRGKEVAKGGAGSRNWGSDKDAAKDESAAAETDVVEEEEAEPEEPEAPTMSYEDYLASKANAPKGEGFEQKEEKNVVDAAFASVSSFNAKSDDVYFNVDGSGKQPKKKGGDKKNGNKQTIVVDFKVKDPNSDRGDRSDRKEGRGDRGGRGGRDGGNRDRKEGGRGGGNRGPRPAGNDRRPKAGGKSVDVSNQELFPALA